MYPSVYNHCSDIFYCKQFPIFERLAPGLLPDQFPEDVACQGHILRVEHVDVRGGNRGPLVVADHLTFP